MDLEAQRAIAARLHVLEALVVMAVGERYVDWAKANPEGDAVRVASQDVRRWFDQLADGWPGDPASLEAASVRLLASVETHVAMRVARSRGAG